MKLTAEQFESLKDGMKEEFRGFDPDVQYRGY